MKRELSEDKSEEKIKLTLYNFLENQWNFKIGSIPTNKRKETSYHCKMCSKRETNATAMWRIINLMCSPNLNFVCHSWVEIYPFEVLFLNCHGIRLVMYMQSNNGDPYIKIANTHYIRDRSQKQWQPSITIIKRTTRLNIVVIGEITVYFGTPSL